VSAVLTAATSGADQLAAWSTFAQAALVALALVVAAVQLADARADKRARERPFVVVEFDGERHPEEVDIVVRNIGATIARDVEISFDPPLQTTFDDTGYGASFMKSFTEGIPALNPGQSLRAMFDTGAQRAQADLPSRYVATISYSGDLRGAQPYSESAVLDLDLFRNRLYSKRYTVHDVYGQLEQMNATLARIAESKEAT
jgi:hypothetical protein